MIDPRLPRLSRAEVYEGLKRFWYDTALSPTALGALREIADPSRVLFGSDWPFANADVVAEELRGLAAPGGLTESERPVVERGNALALFPGLARRTGR
jgi:6-methylsalicylate decarboxylase